MRVKAQLASIEDVMAKPKRPRQSEHLNFHFFRIVSFVEENVIS